MTFQTSCISGGMLPLTEEQKRLYYKQMKKLALAKLDNGELATTASVLTQIMRLAADMLRLFATG